MRSKFLVFVVVASFLLAATFGIMNTQPRDVYAAVPTPQSYNASNTDANIFKLVNARSITADTRWCSDKRNYNALDLEYVIDQGTVNTTTLKLQFSNDLVNFTDASAAIVTDNAADASGFNRYLTFGRYVCVLADVSTSDSISMTIIGVAK